MNKPQIIAGKAKGRKLKVAEGTRPATNRFRQSLFDTISEYLDAAIVLDLFAGSGAFGIEALSRGAEHCTFVDNSFQAIKTIQENLHITNLTDKSDALRKRVDNFVLKDSWEYDIIFCDPPYEEIEEFDYRIIKKRMHENSLLVFKSPTSYQLPKYKTLPIILNKDFGKNRLTIMGKRLPV